MKSNCVENYKIHCELVNIGTRINWLNSVKSYAIICQNDYIPKHVDLIPALTNDSGNYAHQVLELIDKYSKEGFAIIVNQSFRYVIENRGGVTVNCFSYPDKSSLVIVRYPGYLDDNSQHVESKTYIAFDGHQSHYVELCKATNLDESNHVDIVDNLEDSNLVKPWNILTKGRNTNSEVVAISSHSSTLNIASLMAAVHNDQDSIVVEFESDTLTLYTNNPLADLVCIYNNFDSTYDSLLLLSDADHIDTLVGFVFSCSIVRYDDGSVDGLHEDSIVRSLNLLTLNQHKLLTENNMTLTVADILKTISGNQTITLNYTGLEVTLSEHAVYDVSRLSILMDHGEDTPMRRRIYIQDTKLREVALGILDCIDANMDNHPHTWQLILTDLQRSISKLKGDRLHKKSDECQVFITN